MRRALVVSFLLVVSLFACGGRTLLLDDLGGDAGDASIDQDSGILDTGIDRKIDTGLMDTGIDSGPMFDAAYISQRVQDGWEDETQVATASDGTSCVVWQGAEPNNPPFYWMGYRFTSNGGQTWSPIGSVPPLPQGMIPSDPAITVDSKDNFWFSFLGVHFTGQNVDFTSLYVMKAPKGSTTFGAPVAVTTAKEFYDHPKILALPNDHLVVTMAEVQFNPRGMAMHSPDGINWSAGTIISPTMNSFSNLFWPCHSNGRTYAAYIQIDGNNVNVATRSSDDEGATWTQQSTFASSVNDVVAFSDPSCVANGNDVWVQYATTAKHVQDPEMEMEQLNSVWVAQSPNKGVSFQAAVQTADKTSDKVFLHPVMVREPNGTLDVTMYGGKALNDTQTGVRYVHPLVTAKTIFQPLTFATDRTTQDWLGDYIGATTRNGFLDTSFAVNSTGNSHIVYARTKLQ